MKWSYHWFVFLEMLLLLNQVEMFGTLNIHGRIRCSPVAMIRNNVLISWRCSKFDYGGIVTSRLFRFLLSMLFSVRIIQTSRRKYVDMYMSRFRICTSIEDSYGISNSSKFKSTRKRFERHTFFFRVIYVVIVAFLPVVHVVHRFNSFANFIIKVFETSVPSRIF